MTSHRIQSFKQPYNSNNRVSSEGSLLLLSAGLADTANFSCVAENVAAKRVSPPAALKVYVDGSWSSWSAWSECSADCGLGSQKRTRTCTAPPPGHGGASCQGSAFESHPVIRVASSGTVDGAWSAWGEWSTCGPDCTQRSSRACDAPAPLFGGRVCVGDDTVTRNCTGGMCMTREKALQQDITLIVVLAVLVPLVLVLTFFLFRKFASKSRPNGVLYEVASTGYSHPSVNSGSDGAFPAMLHSETHLHVPHGEGTVWEEFGSSGGRLIVPDPLIWCGPPGTKLLKPAVLAFEHSASLQHAAWKLHVFAVKNTAIGSQEQDWQKIITLGEERLDTPVYTQLDGNQAFLMSDCLQPYAVVGESAASSSAVKLVRVVASAPPPAADGQLTITLHVIQNTTAHLKCECL
ncbi:hypothetical protein HAZT_HAZT004273 [Hyalella azteca]|uniref:ZU5 domain-containing protein n=1 Tax=Hyalella azteca TaxID=294128 RepID=A0A6A0H145_HYAAZ|nr:hypothetical protein HAZT_HAZT004273 [Hyalella azteca]